MHLADVPPEFQNPETWSARFSVNLRSWESCCVEDKAETLTFMADAIGMHILQTLEGVLQILIIRCQCN
jgi:hypothetical protein